MRISQDDWQWLSARVSEFSSVVPIEFQLPSRHAISRYIHGFMTGFHPHFPIIHPQTLTLREMAPELILAIAAVGSHYCLESHQGFKIFPVGRAVAMEQLRRRDAAKDEAIHTSPGSSWTLIPPQQCQSHPTPPDQEIPGAENTTEHQSAHADTETMQALFFLMAMTTWSGEHRSLVRQAIATQSVLAMLVRQHGLSEQSITPTTWEEWARIESARRTKLIIFSFFNLHAIAFNLPSPLLIADIQLRIPCSEPEWRCPDSASWFNLYQKSKQPPLFQDCIKGLLHGDGAMPVFSSLGGHVLIHALLQRIICIQQSIRMESMEKHIFPGLSQTLQQALNKWQSAWEENPESSYSPLDRYGPIAFNSRALYHLAHIRLALDIGSARSLLEQSPAQLARKLQEGPRIERSPHLLLAARHAVTALCSPVQMGVHFVGRAPSWSVMHAVCSLEYAYILNQYIQAIIHIPLRSLEEDERALLVTIKETLYEVEVSSSAGNPKLVETELRILGPKVVRAWAMILDGMRTWNAVYLISKTLFLYAELLERDAFVNEPQG
ncbi:hypothetical protein ASPFODRAFT_148145 [Aspergillus luchuensis CBS 106.47]|uniref:Xylanolytic transcriptional activator regulatory domain-containing protein n=1 Tax=Aspergillus luchuensis (strain CBS 106.47) TaxID=1137211 RepID=A0A1M3T0C0_ASPLC|nr:hypothetical protein ASPFODRAFT_148145 [Aspergillus luchuensis CBS 106.47]